MSDLNVTEGEWKVVKSGSGRNLKIVSEGVVISCQPDNQYENHFIGNSYIIAQAKNMYEELKGLSEMFRHEHNGDGIADDIDKILNACKPPKD